MKGPLASRFYYLYAEDYERGGEWDGKTFMCMRDKEFKIRGVEDCFARGFQRAGFFEIDTGEQKNWMVQLTDRTPAPARHERPSRHPEGPMMRRLRRVKILATLGPASSGQRHDREAVRGGRRRLPHQHEPHRPTT